MDEISTIYGPVESWRLGRSLGVDLLAVDSVCSFRCAYCQLGRINQHTARRRVFVPTERVLEDLRASRWREADVITFSGSGEPTLAANLGACVRGVKELTGRPVVVLTNSAHLSDPQVRRELDAADRVFCKLDAADEETFARVNRPAAGLTLGRVVEGIESFRRGYAGRLGVQVMLLPSSRLSAARLAPLLLRMAPDEVQLNSPGRAVPSVWSPEARGGHAPSERAGGSRLRQLSAEEAARFEEELRLLTGLVVVSARRGAA